MLDRHPGTNNPHPSALFVCEIPEGTDGQSLLGEMNLGLIQHGSSSVCQVKV